MFNKVLIANRGAIAVRIIRTLKELGIGSVAVYAEADADSLHVTLADDAYSLGEGAATETYLNQEKLFAVIEQSGAQAVHPGYGFLSENPDFVRACEQRGVAFVGPTPEQMNAFGLKHTARALAEENKVPLLPGTGLLKDLEEAVTSAEHIGYPVILKSTAGGGGIGMQTCYSEAELRKAFDSVKRLSANNFSNDGLFVEKYIETARHIEVQVFGDGQGNAVALGERDCSSQRRNQKVVEECPAPNIPDTVRKQLHDTAVRLAEAVHYRNAGTVEFIYDAGENTFYFLEVNTRLQVEHGVTEQVYDVDLVAWMLRQAAGELGDIKPLGASLKPRGHALQARLYAEDANKNFQPSAGLLSAVDFPPADGQALRIDTWVEAGLTVSPYFDPMLAKVIVWQDDRARAIDALDQVLAQTTLEGIETNGDYVRRIIATPEFHAGEVHTRFLNDLAYQPHTMGVLAPGTMTTVQDFPGRVGYWDIGVPPSGPFDNYSLRLGNRLLGNPEGTAGLEITLNGPTLKFNTATDFVLAGAALHATLDDQPVLFCQVVRAEPGQVLTIGKVVASGARAYLMVAGGIQCADYLGSKSTFTLGQFGGFAGRALRTGDVLHLVEQPLSEQSSRAPEALRPDIDGNWQLRVIYGPHGAPDFFTEQDMRTFFQHRWEVHYNSSRTGIRLIGPKPEWARSDGGEAGLHPSNIHDNAYAIGTVDFTGDMPVILGPDGPSLGGFVCPVTVIAADLWKLGQLKAGDKLQFVPVSLADANRLEREQQTQLAQLDSTESEPAQPLAIDELIARTPVLKTLSGDETGVPVVYRPSGDKYLLVEYGPLQLDIRLRFRAHALMLFLQEQGVDGILEMTPGIRSLQIHYESQQLSTDWLLDLLEKAEHKLQNIDELEVPSRIVHLPLSWDDPACRQAAEKYMQSVRKDAPWCPDNIEFIRRINGLDSIDEVKKILFEASYVVMGLGDVYLGAPVATPLDPRHRLVTTKYNPARTWTAENSVGIGGSYLCVYGMEGPGGYQFVGRTLQMWNRYRKTREFTNPWLLRFFDQIRFYEVSHEELQQIRRDFPKGQYPLRIEETTFKLSDYEAFIEQHQSEIDAFVKKRNGAFNEELQRWIDNGQMNFDTSGQEAAEEQVDALPEGATAVESHVAGNIWQFMVKPGDKVKAGDVVCILESMKMEIEVVAPEAGVVDSLSRAEGQSVNAGDRLLVLS
ncbi:urea carboxylase [Marinimicrobium koreense]|uniref:urea carboxylase n=1 Tax=Marinimicrobium koreense TaxID=306545 RepID=UPI003F71F533